jgi:hypothetical protein
MVKVKKVNNDKYFETDGVLVSTCAFQNHERLPWEPYLLLLRRCQNIFDNISSISWEPSQQNQ